MSKLRINLGKRGEAIAADYLRQKGFKILEKNFRNRYGELDIIALDQDTYVFVEVKTRKGVSFGLPEEAVTARKQKQVTRAAMGYLSHHDLLDSAVRFDVVSVLITKIKPQVSHIVNAFDAA